MAAKGGAALRGDRFNSNIATCSCCMCTDEAVSSSTAFAATLSARSSKIASAAEAIASSTSCSTTAPGSCCPAVASRPLPPPPHPGVRHPKPPPQLHHPGLTESPCEWPASPEGPRLPTHPPQSGMLPPLAQQPGHSTQAQAPHQAREPPPTLCASRPQAQAQPIPPSPLPSHPPQPQPAAVLCVVPEATPPQWAEPGPSTPDEASHNHPCYDR
nr:basic proline-rich protein-like [Coffea arabica]